MQESFISTCNSPIAATSVTVPISLFTIISETRIVSGRKAALPFQV
jgi:hypothetical protein